MIRLATRDDIPELIALANELLPPDCPPPFQFIGHADYFCAITDGGFLLARRDMWNTEPAAFVISAAGRKHVPALVRHTVFVWLNEWAKLHGLKKIVAFSRVPEVFLKRWGFKLESFVISKEVV